MSLWDGSHTLSKIKWSSILGILTYFSLSFAQIQGPGDLACTELQDALGNEIVQRRNDSGYDSAAHGAWNLFNTEYSPACVVLPRNSAHVQAAMGTIFLSGANYSVQAGGHSAMKGWNNVDNGVLISFEFMRNISYDSARDTIIMEPGIRWGESVTDLQAQGVAPVGGRVDDVGTGLLLGGGFSFLSPSHGFSADNFVELDVVLVDGTLVTATETNQFADLFRALKGGANRFGIVTRYEVQAIHTGTAHDKTWFGGTIIYPPSSFEAVAKAVSNFTLHADDPNAAMLLFFGKFTELDNTQQSFAVANVFYNGTSLPNSLFGEFLSIPSLQTTVGPLSYPDIAFSLSEPQPANGHGQLFGASVIAGGEDDMHVEILRQWLNFTDVFQNEYNSTVLAFTPVPVSQIAIGRQRGGNVIDPPLVAYNAVQFQLTLPLNVPAISQQMEDGRQLFFQQAPRSSGFPLYIHEADKKQSVYETYGQYEFLKQTYAKYDPSRFIITHMDGPQGL